MRTAFLAALMLSLGGCLSENAEPNSPTGDDPELQETSQLPEYHLARSFDLLTETVDQTWTWSMSPNMTGGVRISLDGNPTSLTGADSICYRLEWPQGHRNGGTNNCGTGSGNIGLTISPTGLLSDSEVFVTALAPNDFTLRVWAPNGPDTATLHVAVDTYAAS